MRHITWAGVIGSVITATILGCTGGIERSPSGPSLVPSAGIADVSGPAIGGRTVIAWSCGMAGGRVDGETPIGGWIFGTERCPAAPSGGVNTAADVTGEPIFAPGPTNLRATVSGTTVQLNWDQPPTASAWQIEAGSGPGLANLAVLRVGSTSLTVTGVPTGVYFVRVRSGPPNFSDLSLPSNEIIVNVGGCSGPPGPPTGFAAAVNGANVLLTWNPSSGSPTAYVLDVGSSPGITDLLSFNTGNAATSLPAVAPPGRYFARLRGANACGTSAPSNEIFVVVGSPSGSSSTSTIGTTTTVPGGRSTSSSTSTSITGTTTIPGATTTTSVVTTITTSIPASSTTTTALPAGPVASFTAPASCQTGVSCGPFDGSASTGTGLSYSWSFGDGGATGIMVFHSFVAPNASDPVNTQYQFTVTLTVTDAFGRTSQTSKSQVVFKRY